MGYDQTVTNNLTWQIEHPRRETAPRATNSKWNPMKKGESPFFVFLGGGGGGTTQLLVDWMETQLKTYEEFPDDSLGTTKTCWLFSLFVSVFHVFLFLFALFVFIVFFFRGGGVSGANPTAFGELFRFHHSGGSFPILSRDPSLRKPSKTQAKQIRLLNRTMVEKNEIGINP